MEEAELKSLLAEAGLEFLGNVDTAAVLIPPTLATFVSNCAADDGLHAASVPSDDPELKDRANSEWFRLSKEGGLFGGQGDSDFLVAINQAESDQPRVWWWARVRLSQQWDIVGAGAASGVLGNGYCHPAFVMLSLDGDVIVRGDRGELFVEFTLVRDPDRIQLFRQHGERMLGWPRTDDFTRTAISRWLEKA